MALPPSLSTTPRLPAVERAADRIVERFDEWERDRLAAPHVWLAGEQGAGTSTTLNEVVADLRARKIPTIFVDLPELDIDGPFHATMQLASGLRATGSNGVLDVVVDRKAALAAKMTATLAELRTHDENTVVVLDVPASWTRPSFNTDRLGLFGRARAYLRDVLTTADKAKQPIVVGARSWQRSEGEPYLDRIEIRSTSDPKFLADTSRWGSLAEHAERLRDLLGQRVEVTSPLTLRLGVGLLALGTQPELVRVAFESGLSSVVELVSITTAARPALQATFDLLALVRFPLEAAVVDSIVSPDLTEVEREVVRRVLLLDHGHQQSMHAALRSLARRDGAAERGELHETLATHLPRPEAPTTVPGQWSRATELLEYVFHAARGLVLEPGSALALDASVLCAIGKALSLSGKYEAALEVYEAALAIDPNNDYAGAYVPFHLEKLGRDPVRAEKLLHGLWDRDRDNAWWGRRYIRCLARRGRISAAHETWRVARVSLSDAAREDDAARAWLARNFHSGVAQVFLDRGALSEAREVLEWVGPVERHADLDLARSWNRLQHSEEAEEIGFAPFPLVVTFEGRWSRPHVLPLLQNGGLQYSAWYPGRVVSLGARVVLDLVEPPRGAAPARPFQLVMEEAEILAASKRSTLDAIAVGQFLELGVTPDGARRIELHPIRGRGVEVDVGFLRSVPIEPEAGG